MFYFLVMEKPIILFNNPKRFLEEKYYDSSAPEWTWRDMGDEGDSLDGLISAIEKVLFHPEGKA